MDSKLIEDEIIQFKIRSMSDPTLSDIDFKNRMVWITLNIDYIWNIQIERLHRCKWRI